MWSAVIVLKGDDEDEVKEVTDGVEEDDESGSGTPELRQWQTNSSSLDSWL
jgi:hypothetical protein